ncbi:hypothetical protein FZC78_19120 [Rossellomorea vietnamensis]|uniref:Uncharacterized protein n=1 Tax=Rossellomorea vietnamensis TaxID=218284 RepID=A0A5D4NK83_9BACI|nr:hypothetical protein [Rossellomorea vietnamensis]TYS14269.1 hypothetical protein FZC78_19120 [Rossellomorea vietnamensis]
MLSLQKIPTGIKFPLYEGVKLINAAIEEAGRSRGESSNALKTSNEAKTTADDAKQTAVRTEAQLDQVTGASTIDPAVEQMKIDLEGFSHPSPDARLRSELQKRDELLADEAAKAGSLISVTQFPYNAKLDGVIDDSQVIQDALNYAKMNKIGFVLIPYTSKGVRIVNPLTVPKGVTLIGQGTSQAGYLSGGSVGMGIFTKSHFILDDLTGTKPAITVEDNATLQNIGFYYKSVDTNLTIGDVPTFPFTIKAKGFGYTLKNLSVVGASHFIDLESFERGTVEGIYGLVTKVAFRIRRSRDISRIKDVHINPNIVFPVIEGASSEYWSEHFVSLLKRDLTIFMVGSADFYYYDNVLAWGSNKFLHVVPRNFVDSDGVVFDDYPYTMSGSNIVADNTKFGLYIERPLSFTMKFSNLEIVPISKDGQAQGIVMTGGASGLIDIVNYESKGSTGETDKHIVLDTNTVSMVNVSGRFIRPGDDTNRTSFEDMFTVTKDNKLNAEIIFSKKIQLGSTGPFTIQMKIVNTRMDCS